jgi:hypothetical protein
MFSHHIPTDTNSRTICLAQPASGYHVSTDTFLDLQRPMLAALENEHIQLNASLAQHVAGSSSVW